MRISKAKKNRHATTQKLRYWLGQDVSNIKEQSTMKEKKWEFRVE